MTSTFSLTVLIRTVSLQAQLRTSSIRQKAIALVLWLGIIRDVRTALKNNPLPVDTLKELLGKVA